jgi:hypothetical protein
MFPVAQEKTSVLSRNFGPWLTSSTVWPRKDNTGVGRLNGRDYETSPVADALGLTQTILGLANDIQELRNGKISPQDAMARATLAKQMFNGVRLYIQASKFLEASAPPVRDNGVIEAPSND